MRYSAIGLFFLAACSSSGSGGSEEGDGPVTADDLNRFYAPISLAARTAESTPFTDITTGAVTYQGGMALQWYAAPGAVDSVEGVRGLATVTTEFAAGGVTGEVTNIIGSEGLAFDSQPYEGTLAISGAVLPDEADYVVGSDSREGLNLTGGLMSGTLTGPDGAAHVVAAEFSADVRGDDAQYFYGFFDEGTVTVDGNQRDVFTGTIAATTDPVTPP